MRYIAALSLLAALVGSQSVDPSTVPINLRNVWCRDQKAACPLLCTQQTKSGSTTSNLCEPKTLDWSCVCAVGGITPNVSEYSQTIPYYQCTEVANQCVTNCGLANNACADRCRTARPCGAQNPTRVNTTSSTASSSGSQATGAAATEESSGTFGGSGNPGAASSSAAGASSSKSAAITALNIGQAYGLTILFGGFFAGFALLL
ncbi:hypothetical protein EJ08DRAFT_645445 [Tothia fuscella]|uniref:DUF7707 domain-containing protein n=1 Tax=Tothia fuscella TaxID=1048955 RepID=A0A9P4U495_9PEZI|nr:hypothetical protein EJ08DRAFT_645445 [Tothia fuscella]